MTRRRILILLDLQNLDAAVGLIAAPMINAATILIARRRRSLAVWADVCV